MDASNHARRSITPFLHHSTVDISSCHAAPPALSSPMVSPNLIAIVGRPNVGKSALFNRIAGKRIAIVHDEPGVTRDRISVQAEWNGRSFTLVDTGGLGLLRGEKARDVIVQAAFEQVELAIESATVIILVVNLQEGVVPLDREVAQRLRRAGKPVLVAINKADNDQSEATADVFTELGFAQNFPVSAIHQRGISNLMDAAVALLPKETAPAPETPGAPPPVPPLKLAIIGRPNVGKSSPSTPSPNPNASSSPPSPAPPATRWTCLSRSKRTARARTTFLLTLPASARSGALTIRSSTSASNAPGNPSPAATSPSL